jgi:hypothetical protein
MNALVLAKVRSSRRCREGGAAMFIVAMTIAVLASVGMYALAAASNELRTSGNERQNTQTHYLATYGVLGTSHELIATRAQFYMGLMLSNPDSPCVSLPNVPSTADPLTKACRRLGSAELGQAWANPITVPYTGNAPYAPLTAPGSFGATPMSGDFFVELTDPVELSPPARYATDLHFCFVQLTATSSGITQPLFPWLTAGGSTAQYGGEGVETERARIVAGPVMCPK